MTDDASVVLVFIAVVLAALPSRGRVLDQDEKEYY